VWRPDATRRPRAARIAGTSLAISEQHRQDDHIVSMVAREVAMSRVAGVGSLKYVIGIEQTHHDGSWESLTAWALPSVLW